MKKKLVSISQSFSGEFNPGMRDYIEKNNALDDFLFVRNKNSIVKITFDDIKFISFEEGYCRMITRKGEFLLHIPLGQLLELLPEIRFIRTHRNFVVNFNKVEKIYLHDNLIILDNNERVLLSRRFKNNFVKSCKILK